MNSNLSTILVGPIIGKVTENSARILIEIDKTSTLSIELYELPSIGMTSNSNKANSKLIKSVATFMLTCDCTAYEPKIFEFKNLKEKTKYIVKINNEVLHSDPNLANLESSFSTTRSIKNANDLFRIAFISCNSSNYRKTFSDNFNLLVKFYL